MCLNPSFIVWLGLKADQKTHPSCVYVAFLWVWSYVWERHQSPCHLVGDTTQTWVKLSPTLFSSLFCLFEEKWTCHNLIPLFWISEIICLLLGLWQHRKIWGWNIMHFFNAPKKPVLYLSTLVNLQLKSWVMSLFMVQKYHLYMGGMALQTEHLIYSCAPFHNWTDVDDMFTSTQPGLIDRCTIM